MKIFKTVSLVSGFIGLAGVLLSTGAMSAPGKDWDVFNIGQGDPIPASGQNVNFSHNAAGKGWDAMRTGSGEPLPASSTDDKGASLSASTGKGWDVFHTGQGDRI